MRLLVRRESTMNESFFVSVDSDVGEDFSWNITKGF
jgi:hypothetical protein